MKDTDLAWLGGFWDGEGSITMFSVKEKNGAEKIRPTISIVNTDLCLINKTRKILEEMGLNLKLQEYKSKNYRHRDRYVFITSNQRQIIIFLEHILPYVHSYKKQSGEIILEFCKRRQEKVERLIKGSTPYEQKDWDALKAVRSSQTTREASV